MPKLPVFAKKRSKSFQLEIIKRLEDAKKVCICVLKHATDIKICAFLCIINRLKYNLYKIKKNIYIYVMRKPWIRTIHGLPCSNGGSTLRSHNNPWIVCTICRFMLCTTQNQPPQTKGEGHNRREGLQSAVQGDVRNLHLGLGTLHCSRRGLG